MKTYLTFILAVLLCSSLLKTQEIQAQDKKLHITASLDGFEDGTMLYLSVVEGGVGTRRDSAKINQGTFEISYLLPESPTVIYLAGKNFNPFLKLWANNSDIHIEGDKKDFGKSTVQGSPENDVFLKLRKAGKDKTKALALIEENIDSAPSLTSLYFLKDKIPYETTKRLYDMIPEDLRSRDYAKRIKNHLELPQAKVPKVGDNMIDFESWDPEGKKYTLSSLNDRYLMVEFGSSYCGPCFMAVPELSKLQADEEERLRIVSFSLDTRESNWRRGLERMAAKEEHGHILHLWDGEGENGLIPVKYGVSGIPVFYLFDPEGKVVDTWTGYMPNKVVERWNKIVAVK